MKKTPIILLLTLVLSLTAIANSKKSDEINYLDLASLMLKDGNLERAQIALSKVNMEDDKLNKQRFYVISSLLAIRKNNNKSAITLIQKAKQFGEVDAVMNVYLAQAAFATNDFQLTIEALDSAGQRVAKIPSIYLMRSQSYWNLKKYSMAMAILEQASLIFPDNKDFPRRIVFYYLELGYNKKAAELGTEYLHKYQGEIDDYVAIGNAMRASGDMTTALQFLEMAHLKFPYNENIIKSLAAVYIQNGSYYSAATLIHDAALLNPHLIKEAAELYRRAGSHYMALTLNGMIIDQPEKLKQRMALMLQLENFEQAIAMEDSIKRVHLQDDENIMYALAYAFFKVGNYPKAEVYLGQITNAEIFKKASELRRIMADCQQQIWRCQ